MPSICTKYGWANMDTEILFYCDVDPATGDKMRSAMFSKLYVISGLGIPRKTTEAKIGLIVAAKFNFR